MRTRTERIAERVAQLLREQCGGNYKAAVGQWGISLPSLYRATSGKHELSTATLAKVAAATGTTVEWLLTDADGCSTPQTNAQR